ncbi:MAG: phenylalanine--tRNA ligase subunit alpha [Pseudomonadota bacterium]
MTTIMERANALLIEFEQNATSMEKVTPETVEELRIHWLGKKGIVTRLFEDMRHVPNEEKRDAGKSMNVLKTSIEASLEVLKSKAADSVFHSILNRAPLDITLPSQKDTLKGALHPITLMQQKLLKEFRQHGFTVYDGPETDFDFYNFTALNLPADHPARDMQDTFHLKTNQDIMVLRTQTSNIQIHAMLQEKPPLRIVAPGRVYRVDSDQTHTPIFHQIEGLVVDKKISFADLKGMIQSMLHSIYGASAKTRFRPSYFPFVEPGAEVDMQCTHCQGEGCKICKNTGWLEIGGCGMVHPNVFEAVSYDSEEYTGFAFGFGLDRMAMLNWQLPDLRQLFEGDADFQSQFSVFAEGAPC